MGYWFPRATVVHQREAVWGDIRVFKVNLLALIIVTNHLSLCQLHVIKTFWDARLWKFFTVSNLHVLSYKSILSSPCSLQLWMLSLHKALLNELIMLDKSYNSLFKRPVFLCVSYCTTWSPITASVRRRWTLVAFWWERMQATHSKGEVSCATHLGLNSFLSNKTTAPWRVTVTQWEWGSSESATRQPGTWTPVLPVSPSACLLFSFSSLIATLWWWGLRDRLANPAVALPLWVRQGGQSLWPVSHYNTALPSSCQARR